MENIESCIQEYFWGKYYSLACSTRYACYSDTHENNIADQPNAILQCVLKVFQHGCVLRLKGALLCKYR